MSDTISLEQFNLNVKILPEKMPILRHKKHCVKAFGRQWVNHHSLNSLSLFDVFLSVPIRQTESTQYERHVSRHSY